MLIQIFLSKVKTIDGKKIPKKSKKRMEEMLAQLAN